MGGSDASRLHLRSDAASGVMPLGLSATYTAQAAGRRTNPQHDAKKARMKETRLGKRGRGDSHAEGGGACTRPAKKIRPQPAVVLLRRWAVTTPPRPMHKPQLRPHIARRSRCGDGSLSAMFRLGARRGSFFGAALNKRPSLCGVSWWSAGFAQGGAKCKFGVVTGRVAVISHRFQLRTDPL